MESGRVSATDVLVEKRYGVRERLIACQQGTQDAFYLRKQRESGARSAGGTRKFTVEMKRRRI